MEITTKVKRKNKSRKTEKETMSLENVKEYRLHWSQVWEKKYNEWGKKQTECRDKEKRKRGGKNPQNMQKVLSTGKSFAARQSILEVTSFTSFRPWNFVLFHHNFTSFSFRQEANGDPQRVWSSTVPHTIDRKPESDAAWYQQKIWPQWWAI